MLAAGAGRRFGAAKALVELEGESLVQRAVRVLTAGGCSRVHVVIGAQAEQVRALLASEVDVVVAAGWQEGMGASLRAGLATATAPAVVVSLVDQPGVSPEAVRRLVHVWREGAVAAVATYDGAPRNPVLLDQAVWAEVSALAVGDVGARAWLRSHPDEVVAVPCDDVAHARDIDTPRDLESFLDSR